MKKTVLFDLNNLVIRCIFNKDVTEYSNKVVKSIDWDHWKYLIFNSVQRSLFSVKNVNELVLAIDSKNSWRYEVWDRYKENRKIKKEKDESEFPWDEFFDRYEEYAEELKSHFPIKIIKVDRAEADDVIATIAMRTNNRCHIVTTDKDYMQLLCDRISIYNPLKGMDMEHPNPRMFLVEQILCGQAKDNIFNIKTPLDHPQDKRKPGFGPKAFEKVVASGVNQWLQENNLMDRYEFNRTLIDFTRIPMDIQNSIMEVYENYEYPEPNKMWEFVKRYNYPEIIDNFTNIELKFLNLY